MSEQSTLEVELAAAESALQAAMLAGDVEALEQLLHPAATYTSPEGFTMGREADIQAYRAGSLQLDEVSQEALQVTVVGNTGVTHATLVLRGLASQVPFAPSCVTPEHGFTQMADGRCSQHTAAPWIRWTDVGAADSFTKVSAHR